MPNLHLKNFAKIKDSEFDVKDITVFAGKPSTGKSYIMKMMYGMSEAINKTADEMLGFRNKVNKLTNQDLKKLGIKERQLLTKTLDNLLQYEFVGLSDDEIINKGHNNILKSIFGDISQISNNFQVTYDDIILKFNKNNLDVKLNKESNNSTSVIFVETPLILEFKKFMNKEQGKTPYHIESLLKILDKDYSFTDEEQDNFIKSFVQKSQAIINGNIEDSGDSFIYKTNNKDFDIINASSGIKSIGLLQYLVTNKALKKGSILFWEEPEVHLHPTWQLKMIDLFIELMNAGVKIVFSTHSPFMADYLNAKAQRNDFSQRVSFNLLSEENNIVTNTILKDENWDLLQDELMGSFKEIMWQYL